jgi:Asp-tRNA(Asn)/Glu-tRNA(Gln) amidotransferase A subunit family amidase
VDEAHTMTDELVYLDAAGLARSIRERRLSPVEVLAAHRERAAALNADLNALVASAPHAEEHARQAEAAVIAGEELGPLHGVPFTIKDTYDTQGVRTTRGSRLYADHVPERDATVVRRLAKAGGILIAKGNTPEFALWWETGNLVFGRTVNPWDPARTSGGSSGGDAAAVAAGLSPLGVGSDLGGSIRIPAGHCGVVGLKPTHGRVPLTGHWPDVLLQFMHAGPLTRSVEDAALALRVLSGPDGLDWYAHPRVEPIGPQPAKPRVGVLVNGFGPVDPEVAGAVTAAAHALDEAGCDVEQVSVPGIERHDWNALTIILYGAGGRAFFSEVVNGRWDELHPFLRGRLSASVDSLEDYLWAERAIEELRRDLGRYFETHDVLLCPTGLAPAPLHDAPELVLAGTTCPARAMMRATIPFDLSGSPALTVPFAQSSGGLPLGVQLVGRRFEDELVLETGKLLEDARGPLPHPL